MSAFTRGRGLFIHMLLLYAIARLSPKARHCPPRVAVPALLSEVPGCESMQPQQLVYGRHPADRAQKASVFFWIGVENQDCRRLLEMGVSQVGLMKRGILSELNEITHSGASRIHHAECHECADGTSASGAAYFMSSPIMTGYCMPALIKSKIALNSCIVTKRTRSGRAASITPSATPSEMSNKNAIS